MCKNFLEKYRESFKNKYITLYILFSLVTLACSFSLVYFSFHCPWNFAVFSRGVAVIYFYQGLIGLIVSRGIKKIIVLRENCWVFWNYFLLLLVDSVCGIYGFISIMPWTVPESWEKPLGLVYVVAYVSNLVTYYMFATIYFAYRPGTSKFLLVRTK